MNKALINIGVGYATIAAWVPVLWLLKTVSNDPYSFVAVVFMLVFSGLGLLAGLALNDLQVSFDNTNRDLQYCRDFIKSKELFNTEEDENLQEQLDQLRRDLD